MNRSTIEQCQPLIRQRPIHVARGIHQPIVDPVFLARIRFDGGPPNLQRDSRLVRRHELDRLTTEERNAKVPTYLLSTPTDAIQWKTCLRVYQLAAQSPVGRNLVMNDLMRSMNEMDLARGEDHNIQHVHGFAAAHVEHSSAPQDPQSDHGAAEIAEGKMGSRTAWMLSRIWRRNIVASIEYCTTPRRALFPVFIFRLAKVAFSYKI